jgi:hypothetical protein
MEPEIWQLTDIINLAPRRGFLGGISFNVGLRKVEFERLPAFPGDEWIEAIQECLNLSE